jgi:hypothetical protein
MVLPSVPIMVAMFLPVLLMKSLEQRMEYGEETRDTQKKPAAKAIYFADSQSAIDGLLEDWLPRLIENNEMLTATLVRVKGLCSIKSSPVVVERVLAEVEAALERAARANNAF